VRTQFFLWSYSKGLAVLAFIVCTGSGWTIPYNGSGPNSSTINASGPGDYPSLSAALAHLDGGPALTGGDWTFLIKSDVTEPGNIVLDRPHFGSSKFIVKPDVGSSVTVTFGSNAAGAHLTIGQGPHNFLIDGSNNGTSSRNLTLRTNPALNVVRTVIRVTGDTDNCQIKNCTIQSTGLNQNISELTPAIEFLSTEPGPTMFHPDNGLVENNDIIIGRFATASGIATRPPSTRAFSELTTAQLGMVIRNNTVRANRTGVELQCSQGADVYGNKVYVDQPGDISFDLAIGIYAGKGSTTASVVNIYNNQILQVHGRRGPFTPIAGIIAGNAAWGTTYNIYNNIIANLKSGQQAEGIVGIMVAGTTTNRQYANIYHNSIHMPAPATERLFADKNRIAGIYLPNSNSSSGTNNCITHATIRNNIIVNEETTGVAILKTTPGILDSDYNAFYLRTGSAADLAQWQTQSGEDANSTYANPFVAHPPASGKWVSAADLHFNAEPGALFRGTGVAAVTHDIDGELRSGTIPVKGADEILFPTRVGEWESY